jgi:hypothetical protein
MTRPATPNAKQRRAWPLKATLIDPHVLDPRSRHAEDAHNAISARTRPSNLRDARKEIIGVPRALPVRDIPARSLAVPMADQAHRPAAVLTKLMGHDPVAGSGRDSSAAGVLTIGCCRFS